MGRMNMSTYTGFLNFKNTLQTDTLQDPVDVLMFYQTL